MLGGPPPIRAIRQQIIPLAAGDLLEIGIGSGGNLIHYDTARVDKLYALEPNPGMIRLAKRRLQQTPYYKNATPSEVAKFWREHGFREKSIPSEWRFEQREDLEKVVRLEFGDALAERLLAQHDGLQISYHYKLYYRSY